VLVTGASRGIGRAVAALLAARGDWVAACGRDTAALGELVAASAREDGAGHIVAVPGDVTNEGDRARMLDAAHAALGGLDSLVLGAGVAQHGALGAITAEDLDATLRTNLVAPILLAQRALGRLSNGGAIVLLGSNLAHRSVAGTLAYAASKAGLEAAARTMALELAPRGIRVNVVAPGAVDTEMLRGRDLSGLAKAHALGRIGRTDEIAEAVLFLLDSPWTTGTTLVVDGGALLR
jgi:NAD(P)-dependent dehydrogenase (short-subunit alcohol dehydrogenase family)